MASPVARKVATPRKTSGGRIGSLRAAALWNDGVLVANRNLPVWQRGGVKTLPYRAFGEGFMPCALRTLDIRDTTPLVDA